MEAPFFPEAPRLRGRHFSPGPTFLAKGQNPAPPEARAAVERVEAAGPLRRLEQLLQGRPRSLRRPVHSTRRHRRPEAQRCLPNVDRGDVRPRVHAVTGWPLPPNGKRVVFDLINIFRFDVQGRMVEEWCGPITAAFF